MSICDTIYLEGKLDDNGINVSAESLMALFIFQCCENLDANIVFTTQTSQPIKEVFSFRINNENLFYKYEFIDYENCPAMIQNCILPAVQIESEAMVVVGLSASLRHFLNLKVVKEPDHLSNRLLGFRKGCLQSCSEVSIWTKFCEIEVIEMIKELYFQLHAVDQEELNVPVHMIRYERHLERPPILHNVLKRKQDNMKNVTNDKNVLIEMKKLKLNELPELEHKYAEGIDLTLADLILYISFSLSVHRLKNVLDLKTNFPLTLKWLSHIKTLEFINNGVMLINKIISDHQPIILVDNIKINYPDVPNESLYKSDPNRYKSRWRSFTHQKDIDKVIAVLENDIIFKNQNLTENQIVSNVATLHALCEQRLANLSVDINIKKRCMTSYSLCFEHPINWDLLPQEVVPLDGGLPLSRLKRKCQQLESLAQIVIALAKDGDKIVDFCAGGGHLGILLAYSLPKCKILLVENKINSLSKAYKRVKSLNIQNVEFYQCNLDYFSGKFNIGVCLHACGVATDLIMRKCYLQKSNFVCCPCCYGSLRPNHVLNYPRSLYYENNLKISLSDYLILGHAADQTHDEHNPKTEQGIKCMKYVDFDRLSAAQTLGYNTFLSVMNPPECTPKNHILTGIL